MGTDIDLTNSNLTIPPLPLFRNVEKASLPIKYPPKINLVSNIHHLRYFITLTTNYH